MMYGNINKLIGKTLVNVEYDSNCEIIKFETTDNEVYQMIHYSDCCEEVYVEDIIGDLEDLLHSPIIEAREAVGSPEKDTDHFWSHYYNDDEEFVLKKLAGFPELPSRSDESETWTFYILATNKGSVTIRWYGTSNGYYSERVDFEKVS